MFFKYLLGLIVFACDGFGSQLTVDDLQNLIQEKLSQVDQTKLRTNNQEFQAQSSRIFEYGTYDFVVVGLGSAGATITNRLTEVDKWNVIALEAGGPEDDFTDIPLMSFATTGLEYNWGYFSTPQTSCCLGTNNNQCFYPRGLVEGGSSTINAVLYVRGNRADFDGWAQISNDSDWSYDSILPYFRKMETYDRADGDLGYRGSNGPIHVNVVNPISPLHQTYMDGFAEMGYDQVDYNGYRQMGAALMQSNIWNGKRVSTARGYLDPIRQRDNLDIVRHAYVTKVLFRNEPEPTAYGVLFNYKGRQYVVRARKEVILSAGAINTPQILMLSGIGPKIELGKYNIPQIIDLPVGQNMEDHNAMYPIVIRSNFVEQNLTQRDEVTRYLQGGGDYTAGGSGRGNAFINTLDPKSTLPDIQFFFSPTQTSQFQFRIKETLNFRSDIYDNIFGDYDALQDFGLFPVLLHPKSVGRVTLQSSDPMDFPLIDLGYFSDADNEDVKTMGRAIRFIQKLMETEAFRAINATLRQPTNLPPCLKYGSDTDQYWYCAIRYLAATVYHPVATTRMGTNASNAVVDSRLHVFGTSKLRIIDAGIIPKVTTGNTNAPVIMMAERAADIIKEDYGVL